MNEFERLVRFRPAFDKRHPDPKQNYGIHSVELLMVLKGGEGATQFLLYTGWLLPETIGLTANIDSGGTRYAHALHAFQPGAVSGPMPADLGYHSPRPIYEGQEPIGRECEFIDGPCYYDGSGLNAWRPFEALLREGDEGVWRELEDYYKSVFS